MARWRVQDALTISDYACWDLILCRNMAIYLDPEAIRDLWVRLSRALRPGGILVVGRAERPSGAHLRRLGPCIYAREEA
jgi:chemotaxis methyl-accepting protein methylase